jgi:hypothetical protein
MDYKYHLSVPNSNPNSAFSHYQICCVLPIDTVPDVPERTDASYSGGEPGQMVYTLIGIYSGRTGWRPIVPSSPDLGSLKTLLVDINGPIPEEAENGG